MKKLSIPLGLIGFVVVIVGIFAIIPLIILCGFGIMAFPFFFPPGSEEQPELPEEARRMIKEDAQIELTKMKYVKGEMSYKEFNRELDRIMGLPYDPEFAPQLEKQTDEEIKQRLWDKVTDQVCAEYAVPPHALGPPPWKRKDWTDDQRREARLTGKVVEHYPPTKIGGTGGSMTLASGTGGYPPQIQTKIAPDSITTERIQPMDEPYPMQIIPMLESMGIPVGEL